jgi:hypothetical protein
MKLSDLKKISKSSTFVGIDHTINRILQWDVRTNQSPKAVVLVVKNIADLTSREFTLEELLQSELIKSGSREMFALTDGTSLDFYALRPVYVKDPIAK